MLLIFQATSFITIMVIVTTGAFGVVCSGTWKPRGRGSKVQVAVKRLFLIKTDLDEFRKQRALLLVETETTLKVYHKNVPG